MTANSPPSPTPPSTTGESWAQVLERRHGWLRAVALARGGEPAAVDDILQEVAVAAARGHDKLRDRLRTEVWLYRLTVVAALQHRRRIGRQRKLINRVQEKLPISDYSNEPDPFDWVTSQEQETLVREALATLSPKDAEMMLLKYGYEWSYAELAQRLGISVSAVDGRLQRARARLRKEISARVPTTATTSSKTTW